MKDYKRSILNIWRNEVLTSIEWLKGIKNWERNVKKWKSIFQNLSIERNSVDSLSWFSNESKQANSLTQENAWNVWCSWMYETFWIWRECVMSPIHATNRNKTTDIVLHFLFHNQEKMKNLLWLVINTTSRNHKQKNLELCDFAELLLDYIQFNLFRTHKKRRKRKIIFYLLKKL